MLFIVQLLDGASAIHGSYDSMSSELQDDVQKQQWLEAMVQQKCSARERLGLQSALVQDGPFAAPSRLRASTLY